MGETEQRADETPDYGPGGYLPDRAARRARKIVLRERMSLRWVVAAAVAAVVVAAVGAVYLVRTGPPGPPFIAVAGIERFDPRGVETAAVDGAEVLVVRAGGGVRVFRAPDRQVTYCPESRRLEAADGTVWDLRGRRTGGEAASLQPLAAAVHDGVLYVDPRDALARAEPAGSVERPVCG